MGDMTGKRLALIGPENGMDEVEAICKREGITMVSFGYNPDSLIHRISDEQCIVDCSDPDVMIPLVKEKKIDGVFLASKEILIKKCIEFFPKAGIRHYALPEQWNMLMNKANFKKCARKYGIHVVPEFEIDPETGKVVGDITFPAVVKPADNCGSRGISICNTLEEVENAIAFAKENSGTGVVICEKFLKGKFFMFDMWLKDGQAYFPYVKERVFYPQVGSQPEQPFLDISPASFTDTIAKTFYDKMPRIFADLGIRNGECWFQGIMEDGVPYIMDNGFRLSGGRDWNVVKAEKGVDLIESLIRYTLTGEFGKDLSVLNDPITNSYTSICLGMKNGTIHSIEGLDEVRQLPSVVNLRQYMKEGKVVTTSGLFSQTIFRILVKAPDQARLKKEIDKILGMIRVTDENGDSLVRELPDAYYEWIKQ